MSRYLAGPPSFSAMMAMLQASLPSFGRDAARAISASKDPRQALVDFLQKPRATVKLDPSYVTKLVKAQEKRERKARR